MLTTALVPVIVAGGLVSVPLSRMGALWPTYIGVGALALLIAGSRTLATWRGRRGRARTSAALAWAFLGFWVVLAAWSPVARAATPDPVVGDRELLALASSGILACTALILATGDRAGLHGLRRGWCLGLALSVVIAAWELTTRRHLWIDAAHPWPFGDALMAVGTYQNPNNFAGALVAMVAGTLALAARASRPTRAALLALVAAGGVVVFLTGSRSGLAALALVFALEGWRLLRGRLGGRRLRDVASAHRGAATAVLVAGAVVLLALLFAPGVSRNPLRRLLLGAFDPETARSDSLRAGLITAAWRYLRESSWLGSGAGSFEPLLYADPDANVIKLTNLHNAFVELVTQYGVVVGAAFALVLATVAATVARTAWRERGRVGTSAETTRVDLAEATGQCAAFAAFGLSASSALPHQTWWLALAAAAAAASWAASGHGGRFGTEPGGPSARSRSQKHPSPGTASSAPDDGPDEREPSRHRRARRREDVSPIGFRP